MSVKNKTTRKHTTTTSRKKKSDVPPVNTAEQAALANGKPDRIAEHLIDFSPLNYRRYYSAEALQSFADTLRYYGIISPLLVRPKEDRYELVAGERRLRAARIASLPTVPVIIAELTDEQVMEIQLEENMQREDPHPLHEAQAIQRLLDRRYSIDEIAARLGKSASFIYQRKKLSGLVESFQEMFLADAITLTQAIEIAALDTESQQEFFDKECNNWKEEENYSMYNLTYHLNQYKRDLRQAPFDTEDANLLPEAGACTRCAHNTANLTSLFPEMAEQSICQNRPCYNRKCDAFMTFQLINALTEQEPEAILLNFFLPKNIKEKLDALQPAKELPRYDHYEYDIAEQPTPPDREDYAYSGEEGEETFDETGYQQAEQEYLSELEEFNAKVAEGTIRKGLLLETSETSAVYFTLCPEEPEETEVMQAISQPAVTAKAVQEALKAGTATPDLLRAEINRIHQREKRAQEIDREKIQLALHQQFEQGVGELYFNDSTPADQTAARYLVYRSLDYSGKSAFDQFLFGSDDTHYGEPAALYQRLRELDQCSFAYLLRLAMLCQPESKTPASTLATALIDVATHAGVPVADIEQAQYDKAAIRQQRQQERIAALEKKIAQLEAVTNAA